MVGAEGRLVDLERPPHQRLGLLEPVRGLEQLRQVVEADSDFGMVGAEGRLVNLERPTHQRLGLLEPVRFLEQPSQVVETNGDFVIIEDRKTARNGEVVVALIDGEDVTLKKYYDEGDTIRLQPANPDIDPIIVDKRSGNLTIQGIVIGVLRKY